MFVVLRETAGEVHTVLITRSSGLRTHAGQVAFPGGAVDVGDSDAVATAVRETVEETTLTDEVLHPVLVWPRLWIPVSGYAVTPVLGWSSHRGDVAAREDEQEVVAVHSVAVSRLADPRNRRRVLYRNGFHGPGFDVDGLFVWGFTGLLLDRLLHLAGWEQPWADAGLVELPASVPAPPDVLGPREGGA